MTQTSGLALLQVLLLCCTLLHAAPASPSQCTSPQSFTVQRSPPEKEGVYSWASSLESSANWTGSNAPLVSLPNSTRSNCTWKVECQGEMASISLHRATYRLAADANLTIYDTHTKRKLGVVPMKGNSTRGVAHPTSSVSWVLLSLLPLYDHPNVTFSWEYESRFEAEGWKLEYQCIRPVICRFPTPTPRPPSPAPTTPPPEWPPTPPVSCPSVDGYSGMTKIVTQNSTNEIITGWAGAQQTTWQSFSCQWTLKCQDPGAYVSLTSLTQRLDAESRIKFYESTLGQPNLLGGIQMKARAPDTFATPSSQLQAFMNASARYSSVVVSWGSSNIAFPNSQGLGWKLEYECLQPTANVPPTPASTGVPTPVSTGVPLFTPVPTTKDYQDDYTDRYVPTGPGAAPSPDEPLLKKTTIIVVVAVSSAAVGLLLGLAVCLVVRRMKRNSHHTETIHHLSDRWNGPQQQCAQASSSGDLTEMEALEAVPWEPVVLPYACGEELEGVEHIQ